ncbi:uncharacterized protein LOC116131912 [Pistacia vera]|uniref:uncharacterized protein LOC116131912 n=1 Tax=Pistacia vera TaxID=55513 RepID=UPI0012634038|nr:uncharacterized protein LOC116131912 [Pistacia vera]
MKIIWEAKKSEDLELMNQSYYDFKHMYLTATYGQQSPPLYFFVPSFDITLLVSTTFSYISTQNHSSTLSLCSSTIILFIREMEVVIPAVPIMDFEFNSVRSSPYLSAPTSPKRFGDDVFFTSAPTSPSRISQFYSEFDNLYTRNDDEYSSTIPFDWEEKPGTPKSQSPTRATTTTDNEDDFAFNFSEEKEKESLTAEELFDGGKIRPLKPPPRLQLDDYSTLKSPLLSPRSPRSPISQGKKIIRQVFSPRSRKDVDPFAAAVENTRNQTQNDRGRESRVPDLSKSSSRRATRSLSPFRVSAYPWEEEEKQQQQQQATKQSSFNSKSSSSSSKSSSRKWRLRDFLLFRSASEGRSTDKEPKYRALFKKNEDMKNSSFRSTDSSAESVSGSRRRGQVSAHELHYTKNKAASEDLKKRTFLPYKHGILGRLAINPLANGFRS